MPVRETTTTVSDVTPHRVVRTTTAEAPVVRVESPQRVYETKKTIFRFYQVFWYLLSVIETLLVIRFILKLTGANPFTGFTSFVYGITDPLAVPFQGIFPYAGNGTQYIEWASVIAMLIYALIIYGIVTMLQLLKPVTPEEVEQGVDEV